jgi:hypothetical protein
MLDIRIYVVHAPNERQVGRVWKDIYHCQCADPACHSINNHPYSCYTLHRGVQAFDAAARYKGRNINDIGDHQCSNADTQWQNANYFVYANP